MWIAEQSRIRNILKNKASLIGFSPSEHLTGLSKCCRVTFPPSRPGPIEAILDQTAGTARRTRKHAVL